MTQRTEEMWWNWHDQIDQDTGESRTYGTMEEAEAACAAWIAGESDEGPEDETMRDIIDMQIETLRTEAGQAGDTYQVQLCDLALEGDEQAREFCAEAIASAEAMQDEQ